MRPTYSHFTARAWQIIAALCICISLSAQNFEADRDLFDAYQKEDMSVWKKHIDNASLQHSASNTKLLLYEYGLCGYMADRDKTNAMTYIKQFRRDIEAQKESLPAGYYEMYLSAVYIYEYKLRESFHPIKAMSLAKEATQLAPDDPLVLSYYGTCMFYAPKPFGSKQEALEWFNKAKAHFDGEQWQFCWVREATEMYIRQCQEKLKKQ